MFISQYGNVGQEEENKEEGEEEAVSKAVF